MHRRSNIIAAAPLAACKTPAAPPESEAPADTPDPAAALPPLYDP
jgi:hypothetical protein